MDAFLYDKFILIRRPRGTTTSFFPFKITLSCNASYNSLFPSSRLIDLLFFLHAWIKSYSRKSYGGQNIRRFAMDTCCDTDSSSDSQLASFHVVVLPYLLVALPLFAYFRLQLLFWKSAQHEVSANILFLFAFIAHSGLATCH